MTIHQTDEADLSDPDEQSWEHDAPAVIRVEIAVRDGMSAAVTLGLQRDQVDDDTTLGVALAQAVMAATGGFRIGDDRGCTLIRWTAGDRLVQASDDSDAA